MKASGNEFQLGVLVKLCGKLRAVSSDHATNDQCTKRDSMTIEEATVSSLQKIRKT
jgi:hypothetical protein